MLVGVPLAMSNLPDKWFGRMETIQTYEEDRSARGRLEAWQVATRIASDHPFMGGGFRTFTREQFDRYGFREGRDAHSIYFQVLGEHGFVGLALYLGLILSTLLSLRRLVRRRPDHPGKAWIPECARMVEASLVGYLIAGAFLSMSYFDLFYGLVALTVLLKVLAAQPVPAEQAIAAAAAPAPVPTRRPLLVPARAARLQARVPRP
jgi:probable O-glycosylation ligase (exosortase A-associated)